MSTFNIAFNATFSLVTSTGGSPIASLLLQLTETMTGSNMQNDVISVGTSGQTVDIGSVTTIGWLCIKNLDGANYMQVDAANNFALFPQKIIPGECVFLRPETNAIFIKANTSAVNAQVMVVTA